MGSDVVVLPPFSCVGSVVQVSAVTIVRAMSIQPEATPHGPLPQHLGDIVRDTHPSLGAEGRTAFTDLLYEYNHVFPTPGDPVTGRTQEVRHEIETNGTRPVRCRPRHLAPAGL